MPKREPPDLLQAMDAEALADELETGNPLQLIAGTQRSAMGAGALPKLEAWQLPVDLPPGGRRAVYRRLPIDVTPLFDLYEQHRRILGGPGRWNYRHFYLEILAREGRLVPAFWVQRNRWPAVRGTHELTCRREGPEAETRWAENWRYLLRTHVVQWKSPDNWLDLVEIDEGIVSSRQFIPECIRLRMVPVYTDITADDVRRYMLNDMLSALVYIPENRRETQRRWRRFAERIGLPQRWPTQKALLLDQRKDRIVAWVKSGMSPPEMAQKLIEARLYPVRERDNDPWYDSGDRLRNATRTTYRLIDELIEAGRIEKSEVKRGPRGRPRKRSR